MARARGIAVLLGLACTLFLALPGAAQALIQKTYFTDPDDGLRKLLVIGDETSQPMVLTCDGIYQAVNGNHFPRMSVGRDLYCNEIDVVIVEGRGGDDTIDTKGVSRSGGYSGIVLGCCDSPQAPADAVSLIGNEGADTIIGGPLGESINYTASSGEQGPDKVRAGAGNDEIYGTDDPDDIAGEGGEDIIYPQLGSDLVHGNAAHDAVEDVPFGKDIDRIFGDGGADQLFAGGGNDRVDGGDGKDFMDGGPGKDRMFGRAGADGLFGKGGNDFLFGNAGNDYLSGGAGNDVLNPGSGRDKVLQ